MKSNMYWSDLRVLILTLILYGSYTLPLDAAINGRSTVLSNETDGYQLGNHIHEETHDSTFNQPATKQKDKNQANRRGQTKSLKACDDFFSFVCDNITEKEDQEFSALEEIIETQKIEALAPIKNFYRACVNKTSIDKNDFGVFKQLIDRLWRLQPQNLEFNWTILARNLDAIGFETFWRIEHKLSKLPGLDYEIWLYQRKSLFHRHTYDQLVKIMMLVGVNRTEAETAVNNARIVERTFNQLRQNNGIRHINNINDLNQHYPWINWQEYMSRNVPSHILLDIADVSTMLFLSNPIDTLTEALDILSLTEIASYLYVRFVDDLLAVINNSDSTKSKKCGNFIKTTLPMAANIFYFRKYFTENYKKQIKNLVDSIREQTAIEVTQAAIPTDRELKRILGDTVKAVKLGIELEFCDDRAIEERYKGLVMSEDDFIGSFFNYTRYRLDLLDKSNDPDLLQGWIKPMKPRYGIIDIPANILRTNYFRENQPMYLNYAGIGRVISKKILQTAVSRLRVNKQSHLQPLGVLLSCQASILMKRLYNIDVQFFTDMSLEQQYYERLSLKSSYAAYQKWRKQHNSYSGTCQKHPSVNSSSNPMFWISSMRSNCLQSRQNMRVVNNANFMDLPEFRDDFHCQDVFENSCLPKGN